MLDETGNRYGKLVVLERATHRSKNVHWLCECDCGNTTIVDGCNLRRSKIKGCGCGIGKYRFVNEVGNRYGKLVVVSLAYFENGTSYWRCVCDCGGESVISRSNISRTRSCGCEILSGLSKNWGKILFGCGNSNPMWKGGVTPINTQIRTSTQYKEWRGVVFKLHEYTCIKCGLVGGKLAAHHVESFDINPDLRMVETNGVCLCKTCHNEFHNRFGRGGNTPAQFEKFMENSP